MTYTRSQTFPKVHLFLHEDTHNQTRLEKALHKNKKFLLPKRFGIGTRCGLEILHKHGKKFEIKSQKIFGTVTFLEITGETFLPPRLSS